MFRWLTIYLFTLASSLNPALAALTVNQLSGFNAFTASGAPPPADPTVEYNGCTSSDTNASTYTFSSFAVGDEAGDRIILVGTAAEDSSDSITHPTVTIGGVNATEASTGTGTYSTYAGFAIAAVPTGTSISIVTTYSETMTGAAICVWSLYGFSSASFLRTDAFGAETVTGFRFNDPVVAGDLSAGMCVTGGNSYTIASEAHWSTLDWTDTNTSEFSFARGYTFPVPTTETVDFGCGWSGSADVYMRIVAVSP